jgi:asparagine synthase (glutamine-hydrolysing)
MEIMEIDIHLENPYFPWTKTEGNNLKCWLKGDLLYKDTLLEGPGIISLFSSLPSSSGMNHDALKDLLVDFKGCFALVIETREGLLCVVDRIRSIPLFYAKIDTRFIISDDANYIRDQINPLFNKNNGAEFLVTGYVTGPETLFDEIYQIRGGQYLSYSGTDCHITTSFYHRFWHEDFFPDSEEELMKCLDEVFVHVFQRLIASTKGKGLQIIVPLSGGLDSRIIIAMLKRLGVDDVICFSYGKKGNHEAEISKKVAEALGYQWYFVEYTNDKWFQCRHSEEMSAYERYAGNLASLPHVQDFLALQELQKEGKIPKKSVFIPGHCGNLIAGDCLPKKILEIPPNNDQFITFALHEHYLLWPWNERGGEELEILFRRKIQQAVGKIAIHNAESLANVIEYFNGNERQAKFIVNSVRVYEFFGYAWKIPLWDAEDFFLRVPLKYRMRYGDNYLYIIYAKKVLFTDNRKKLWDIDCTTKLQYNPNKTFKKKCENIIDNNKLLKKCWHQYYFFKRRKFAFNKESNAHFGMIAKEKLSTFFTGKEFPASFLTMSYLEKFIPSPLDLIGIKKRL